MSNFTPGPWSIGPIGYDDEGLINDHGGIIASADWHGGSDCRLAIPNSADAHLIAAAPDMYEALKAIDTHWAQDGFTSPDSAKSEILADDTRNIWRQIRAALARAEGRS